MRHQHYALVNVLNEADQLYSSSTQSIDISEQLISDSHSELNDLAEKIELISEETATHYQVITHSSVVYQCDLFLSSIHMQNWYACRIVLAHVRVTYRLDHV